MTHLFALGALFYELLTNQPAFPGDERGEAARRILSGERRALSWLRPQVPFELDELVLRALGPHDRITSARQFASLLEGRNDPITAVMRGLFGAEVT